jgi:hypothetical protein
MLGYCAAAAASVFVLYGGWLTLRELALRVLQKAPTAARQGAGEPDVLVSGSSEHRAG